MLEKPNKQSLLDANTYQKLFKNNTNNIDNDHPCFEDMKQFEQIVLQRLILTNTDILRLKLLNLNNLRRLQLRSNQIGSLGCKYISQMPLSNLTIFNIAMNQIKDIGVNHLSKTNWKKLSQIILINNKLNYNGMRHLVKSNWKYLQIIDLNINKIKYQQSLRILLLDNLSIIKYNLIGNPINNLQSQQLNIILKQKFENNVVNILIIF